MNFESLLFFSTLLYVGAVLVVLWLLLKNTAADYNNQHFISIVIAARNEAQRIKPAIDSLLKINYPKNKYEVIWVDDASGDETAGIINEYVKTQKGQWRLIRLKRENEKLNGKKAALSKAIEHAKGEIILTTDADCRVPENWLSEMAALFDDQTIMVLGHSVLEKKKGFFDKLLRFDNLFSGIMVAAPTQAGFAVSSVGRNMAYRKSAYRQAGGFGAISQHKSGDDVHLTELFRRKVKGKIAFCTGHGSFTFTKTPDKIREVIFQQIRKNSKLFKKSFSSIALTVFLFFYFGQLVIFPFVFPGSFLYWKWIIITKQLFEFLTLIVAAKKLGDPGLVPLIPFFQIIYPFYVTFLAVIGSFQIFEWKK